MFIFPADQRFSQGRWPLITLALVLINSFVFFVVQGDDRRYASEAFQFYLGSKLPRIEVPRYLSDLRARDLTEKAARLEQALADEELDWVVIVMQGDEDFVARLDAGQVVRSNEAVHDEWRALRGRFDALLERSVTDRYVFNPAEPQVVTALTHMFMHASTGHLIGNMVVLTLTGVLVEFALGPVLFPLLYLLGGLCGIVVYWLVNYEQAAGVLGASGAVSAVMAMVAVLYGRRKVRFFYTLLFYFDFIMLPAIVVLPVWLGWEILQHFISDSRVAYEAHAGGLMGGALLTFLVRNRVAKKAEPMLDRPEQDAKWEQEFQQGMHLMARLEFQRANALFERLRAQRPAEARPLLQMYRIAKASPASDAYHRHAQALLDISAPDAGRADWVDTVFDEYWTTAQPQARIDTALMIRLLNRYAAAGDSTRVDRLLGVLLRGGCRDRAVSTALLSLAARVSPEKGRGYRALAARHFSG